ncbi:hypothetical protein ES705_28414 [subsurface metagenome]
MSTNGDQELKIYEVTNKDTGEKRHAVGVNQQDVCRQIDWLIGDCFIREEKPQRKAGKDEQSGLLVKIPCQVCPFQYAECRKPAEAECPVRPNAPELREWLGQALEAHACDYYGQELSHTDYQLGQKWLPMEQAIEELGDHH